MRAVVLVGGFGTRLRPLTLTTPKQMLPVVDRPMIEWVVEHLADHGIDEAVLALGYRPDAFTDHYREGTCAGVRLHYAVEPEPLDTAGAIRFAAKDADIRERFIVLNGDVLTDLDLGLLLDFHERSGAEGTIHLVPVDDPTRYGVVPIDEDGRVREFVEKPPADRVPSRWINAGTYVLEPSVLDRIPADRPVSIERETFPAMVADRTLFALESDVYWIDAGTPGTYLQAQLDLTSGRRTERVAAVDPSATIDATATVEHVVAMAGAIVQSSAEVRNSVLASGSVVGARARVSRCLLGPNARVGAGAVLDDCVLGEQAAVPDGQELVGASVPDGDGDGDGGVS
jgi:mannose-1-phosphate guanylyltransferase